MTETANIGDTPKSTLRPIIDRQKFGEAVLKFQRHVKREYGYAMPYDQASGLVQGDPNASSKIRIELPTMALQDQKVRHAIAEGGLMGLYQGKPTLEARRVELDKERFETESEQETRRLDLVEAEQKEGERQFDLTFSQHADEVAARLGLDRDIFLEGRRQWNLGMEEEERRWAAEHNLDWERVNEAMRQFDVTTVEGKRQFDTTTAEDARQFDLTFEQQSQEAAARLGLDERIFKEGMRQWDLGRGDQRQQWADKLGLSYAQIEEEKRQADNTRRDQIDQFAQVHGLDEERFKEEMRQFDKLEQLERERMASELDLQKLAQQNRIELIDMEASISEEAERRAYLRTLLFRDIDIAEADKHRIWQSTENELDRTFRDSIAATDRNWQERQADRQREAESWNILIEGVAGLTAAVATPYLNRLLGLTDEAGEVVGKTAAQIAADRAMGRPADWRWHKELSPELTNEQAMALADNWQDQTGWAPVTLDNGNVLTRAVASDGEFYVDEDGFGYDRQADGTFKEMESGDTFEVKQEGAPPTKTPVHTLAEIGDVEEVAAPKSWGDMMDEVGDLTPKEMMTIGLAFGSGLLSAQQLEHMPGVMGGITRMEVFASMIVAGASPLAIAATAAGMIAHGIWRSFNPRAKRDDRHLFAGPDLQGTLDLRPPEALIDPETGYRIASSFRMIYQVDWHQGEWDPNRAAPGELPPEATVEWVGGNGQTQHTEKLTTFVERTGIVPMTFQGAEDELYGDLPEEIKQRLDEAGFKPRFATLNTDGSITLYSEGNKKGTNYKKVTIEPEDVEKFKLLDVTSVDGFGAPADADNARGESAEVAMLSKADATSQLTENQIQQILDGIKDETRRMALLKKLADAEPFTDADIDHIFNANPETGNLEYLTSWQLFNDYVGAGKIVMREPMGA